MGRSQISFIVTKASRSSTVRRAQVGSSLSNTNLESKGKIIRSEIAFLLTLLFELETKHPSTSEEVLLALREKHSLPDIILEHRHLQKLLRSFIDPFVNHATSQKGTAGLIFSFVP